PLPKTEDEALTAALRENPDILGAVHTAESSRHDIDVASASLRPSLSLQVDLSRTQTEASLGSMTNSAQVLARLSMPLYQSGSEYSLVRQRKDTANQRRLQVEQARSQVRQQVTQAWQALQTARAQVSYRTEQVRASGAALAAIARQAELGAATTLEVLTAQQVRLQAQVALATAHHDEHVAAYGLRAVMGQLTAEALHLPVEAYDPRAHYRRVRHQLFGTTARGEN
ncbi:MAG: TolC family protein, partial [Acidobacteriota bacterium]